MPGARPGPDPASAQRPVRGRRGVGGSAQALASERNPTSHGASPGASQTRPGTQVGCRVCAASWPRCPGTAAAGEASPGSVGGAVPNPVLPSRAQPQGQCCYFSVRSQHPQIPATWPPFPPSSLESRPAFALPTCAHVFGWQTGFREGRGVRTARPGRSSASEKPVMGHAAALEDTTCQQPGPCQGGPATGCCQPRGHAL